MYDTNLQVLCIKIGGPCKFVVWKIDRAGETGWEDEDRELCQVKRTYVWVYVTPRSPSSAWWQLSSTTADRNMLSLHWWCNYTQSQTDLPESERSKWLAWLNWPGHCTNSHGRTVYSNRGLNTKKLLWDLKSVLRFDLTESFFLFATHEAQFCHNILNNPPIVFFLAVYWIISIRDNLNGWVKPGILHLKMEMSPVVYHIRFARA